MADSSDDRWYDLGSALERARQYPTKERLNALVERLMVFRGSNDDDGSSGLGFLLDGGVSLVAGRMLTALPRRNDPGFRRIAEGAVFGAAATLLRELASPVLHGRLEAPEIRSGLPERMFSGAARGAAFAGVLDPRLPGPPALRGAVYATVEYLLSPGGGLIRMVQRVAPWRRIPGARSVVESLESGEDTLVDHLVFGLALALMLGED